MIETDILIVGSGPAGLTAALALSTYGIRNLVVTKYGWLANSPRAHITNQRTFEVLRDLGVEDEAVALATQLEEAGRVVFCTSLAGEELARTHGFGSHPSRAADYALSSPSKMGDLPQNLLEPILLNHAANRGSRVRFDSEYLSHVQDAEGVTATVKDRLSGETYEIRAKYMIGADGGRSKVAEDIGLPMEGRMGLAGSMNISFEADLTQYAAHRPAVLYMIVQPGLERDGVGIGVVRMVRPWKEWLLIRGYDLSQPAPQLSDEEAIRIVRQLVGDDRVAVKIKSTSLWTVNHQYATRYSVGRVFCMGDAVHRHPPMNGLGSNTSIQDAYNLAWKLALVLRESAGPALLESYDAERAPVGRQVVLRANKSGESYGPIFEALGLIGTKDPVANIEGRKAATPEAAARREALRRAVIAKEYEYSAHGVELTRVYASSAVVPDGSQLPAPERDAELYYQRTTFPGSRLPHVWLQRGAMPVSTLDLVGQGRFTVLTGIGGEAWKLAADRAAELFGLAVETVFVGPGHEVTDLCGEWDEVREVTESGCLLVRPDGHIGWRAAEAAADAEQATEQLRNVLGRILGRAEFLEPDVCTGAATH